MSTRHIAAEHAEARDLTPKGSSGGALRRFRRRLAADGFATDEGWRPKEGYLYTVVRAISARVNQNWDGWPSEELKKSYKTFIGKPVFVNHENHDPTKARGVVVAARYVENGMDKYVETVMEVDAGRFPKLAHEIKTGGLDSVSMGAEAGFTICSYCHNKATDLDDMCDHVRHHKGKTLTRFDKRTGKKEDVLVFESCHKISFFELSYVFEPADETAVASKVVVAGLDKSANPRVPGDDDYVGSANDRISRGSWYRDGAPASPIMGEDEGYRWMHRQHSYSVDHAVRHEGYEWRPHHDPDEHQDPFDPRLIGASRRTAEDLAVPAPPGTPTIDQSVIDATPVIELNPATELTGHEAPGVPKSSAFAADIAEITKLAGDCPPGMDCRKMQEGEQITKDSPNNPVNQVSYTPGNVGNPSSAVNGGGGSADGDGVLPGSRALYDQLLKDHPGAEIGGYRPPGDGYDEHANGALDFMTTDDEVAARVRETAFSHGAPYVIWKQQQYDAPWHNSGGVTMMEDRGDPTQNHFDHVHIAPLNPSRATFTTNTTSQPSSGVAPAQRAAGKYTKEDFAAAGGKKPWETDTAKPERGPVEDADLKEIEAMVRSANATDDPTDNPTDNYLRWRAERGEEADKQRVFSDNPPSYRSPAMQRWLDEMDRRDRRMAKKIKIRSMVRKAIQGDRDDDLPPLPGDFHVPDNLSGEKNTSSVEPWMDPEEFIKYHNDYFGTQPDPTTQSNIRDMSTHELRSYWQDLEKQRGKTPDQLHNERQQSRDKARELANSLWDTMYPPGEEEGRKADQNMDTVGRLMDNGWQPEHIRYDEDDNPYAHYQHPSGWSVTDRGGMYKEIGHAATPGEAHDVINVSRNVDGQDYHAPFGPADAHNHIEEQLHGDPEETGGTFQYLTQNDPRIKRYRPRTAMAFNPYSQNTQRGNTFRTNLKAEALMDDRGAPDGERLDFGAGEGLTGPPVDEGGLGYKTYEPHPNPKKFVGGEPTYRSVADLDDGLFHRIQSTNVLNVLEPGMEPGDRHHAIFEIGRLLAPGGHAVLTARDARQVMSGTTGYHNEGDEPNSMRHKRRNRETGQIEEWYQYGYPHSQAMADEVSGVLGDGYHVEPVRVGSAPVAVHIIRHPDNVPAVRKKPTRRRVRNTALKRIARRNAVKLAYGETEAPLSIDTLREEGSALEDDNDDFERYVDPPKELQTPDLSQAAQIDRQQEVEDQQQGVPGPAEGGPVAPQQQYMTLQIPMPAESPQVPQNAVPPQPGMMPPAGPGPVTASMLDWFDRYYGRRVANWMDAIEAGRGMTPAEAADYRRQAARLSTLPKGRELLTNHRNPQKGTANMARTSIASRNKVATAGRRQHFAEGPLVDGGDRSRNDQGEQEEAFISQTPDFVEVDFPDDDTPNISNTEHNLVARVQRGRQQLLADTRKLADMQRKRAFDESGGPVAEVVDPTVNAGTEAEELTGDDFVSANPNDGVTPTNPKDASLRAFAAFDGWLAQKTGKSSRRHTEATIKKAAAQFSREAGISPQALFPALGIVLREARKNNKKANTKGAKMRKRADEKLEVAAPDGRIDVEAPVSDTTDAEAQASQFDIHDFGNNAGDNVAKPDLSTDQNWAPGEASKTSARVKTAGGLLAMRCAEGMIAAGLEPDSRERKYQLAAEYEQMNRGLIQDRVALLERFAAVRQAERRKVASGSSRGAARSPIPAGMGGGTRTASAPQRLAAHDPRNDSSLFI